LDASKTAGGNTGAADADDTNDDEEDW